MRRGRNKSVLEAEGNPDSVTTTADLYATWYDFKKDLERKLGHNLINSWWLEAKPKAPLPWDDSQMKLALSAVARSGRRHDGLKDER